MYNKPAPAVARRRAQAAQALAARRASEHIINIGRIAEAALRARPAVPTQRKGPVRDARGRFVKASS